jgi:hypothetical protein
VRGEAVELVLPELSIRVEPCRRVAHRVGREAHAAHSPVAPPLHQPRPLEHDEVLADRGERHREGARQLADGRIATGESRDDRSTGRVGEGAEDEVEAGL